jgi:uncharacterized repeat protein (TIGR01451 family)
MKKSLGSLIALNRKALLMLGVMLSLAVFGIATWRTSAWSLSGSSAQLAEKGGDPEAVRILEEHINNGNFELMSSAKQLQLQLQAGMKYEDGILKPGLPNDVRPYKQLFNTKRIEALASSESILAALANPLVNNPALDATAQKTQSETTLLLIGGNNLVASYNDSGSFLGGVNSFTGYSTTTDMGTTWTDRGIVPLLGDQNFGDPVLARNATTGRVLLATLAGGANGMNIYRSDDGGVTFTGVANGAPDSSGSANTDKEWIAVDNFAGGGNGNAYHVYRDFGAPNGIFLNRSTDNGATFPAPKVLIASGAPGNVQGPLVAVGADHAVYVFFYDSSTTPDRIAVRKSTDQGVTFGATVTISNLVTAGTNGSLNVPAGYRSSAFPSCAASPVNANFLVCVHGDLTVSPDSNIFYNQSADGGATWSANQRLNNDAGTNVQTHPAITFMPDGSALASAWQDSRSDPANRKVQRFGVIGTIAGTVVTFGNNFAVSQPSWTPIFGADPVVNAVYMGDYDQMDADNSNFYTTFVDCRNTADGQDVRFAKIPKAGPGAIIGFRSSAPTALNPANNSCTDLFVTVGNDGTATANAVTANFTTATPGVTLTQNTNVPYGNIAAGATSTNVVPIKMSVASNFLCGTPIVIDVAVSTGETFSFTVNTQGLGYAITTTTGNAIDPGVTNVGNAGDDTVTSAVPVPFPFPFNGTNWNAVNLSSNGNAQFTTANTAFTNVCPLPSAAFNNALYGHWDDLHTGADATGCAPYPGTTCGIFTSTTGVTPNRIFNIEWRARTFSTPTGPINFEIRLYETGGIIEYVYGNLTGNPTNTNGNSASVGVQKGTGAVPATDVSQFSCNTASLSTGLKVIFTPVSACPQGQGTCVAGNSADLAITKTDGVTTVNPGQGITYTIVARNNGPNPVTAANVSDNFPTPALTGVNWTCVASVGSSCPAGAAGNINAPVNLLVNGTATFTATATVNPAATFGFSNTATVAVPIGTIDPVPGNNSARDTDAVCPPAGPVTFQANTPTLGAIPDNLPATPRDVTFTVAGITGAPTNVEVSHTYAPAHTWAGDINVNLIAPNATSFVIYGRTGQTGASAGDSSDLSGPYNFKDSAAGVNWWTAANTAGAAAPVPPGDYRTTAAGPQPVITTSPVTNLTAAFAGVANANGLWTLRFTDNAAGDTGSVSAASLTITGQAGVCVPTAAGVTVSGRVLTPDGYGLRNAVVTITDSTGMTRTARTSSFGYYTFEGIEVGGTYVMSVGSKRFTFTPRTLTVNDAVSDFDFTADGPSQ